MDCVEIEKAAEVTAFIAWYWIQKKVVGMKLKMRISKAINAT